MTRRYVTVLVENGMLRRRDGTYRVRWLLQGFMPLHAFARLYREQYTPGGLDDTPRRVLRNLGRRGYHVAGGGAAPAVRFQIGRS